MSGCVHCGGARMAGRRVCTACYNAARRQRYASPRPQARTLGRRTSATREPGRFWCWWCQDTHARHAFGTNRSRKSGVAFVCKEGTRTLYRLRTLGRARVPARGRRRAKEETP